MEPNLVVFSELLVAGIQATIWVALSVGSVLGVDWVSADDFEGWELAAGVALLAFAYSLGVLVDRAADRIFRPFDNRVRDMLVGREHRRALSKWRLEVISTAPELGRDLAYARSRTRIARATAVNLFLITVAGSVFVVTQTDLLQGSGSLAKFLGMVSLGLAVSGVACWSWWLTTKGQYEQITAMKEVVEGKGQGDVAAQP